MYVVNYALILNNGEQAPKGLAAFSDQASHCFCTKVSSRETILPVRSARRGRQTIPGLACRKSPHTPGQFPASEHENSFRHDSLPLLYPHHSCPTKKPLPPVKVQFASG